MASPTLQQWMRRHPLVARIIAMVMLAVATGMFTSNFVLNERRRSVPHSYVFAGIVLAVAWLAAFAYGLVMRSRGNHAEKPVSPSGHFAPAVAIGCTLLLGVPVGRLHTSYLFPPRWQVVGDAVGVVVASAMFTCTVVVAIRMAMKSSPVASPELLSQGN